MSITSKARTLAYDNIAQGSVTGSERTISGALSPAGTTFGNTENISVGVDYGSDENIVVKATNMLANERLTP